MKLDPVLAEIRAAREAYSERFGGDVRAMLDDLRKREQQSGRTLVSRAVEPPPIKPSISAEKTGMAARK
jgi:hypothetical protein